MDVLRRDADPDESAGANRRWWDGEAADYYLEHGAFLGDADFVWGPEGLRESDAALLGPLDTLAGRPVLEIGAGAGQCARWLRTHDVAAVATDLSVGMLRAGQAIDERTRESGPAASDRSPVPFIQCDGRSLPFADESFEVVFTAYGVVPFVADSDVVMAEAARVLRPGGRFVYSTTHPFRWALPDDPSEHGLVVRQSYFDRTPYVETDDRGEATYVEHHRTMGDRIRELATAGFRVLDVVEPEWPDSNPDTWGGWSPLRGRLIPGTAIFVAQKPL